MSDACLRAGGVPPSSGAGRVDSSKTTLVSRACGPVRTILTENRVLRGEENRGGCGRHQRSCAADFRLSTVPQPLAMTEQWVQVVFLIESESRTRPSLRRRFVAALAQAQEETLISPQPLGPGRESPGARSDSPMLASGRRWMGSQWASPQHKRRSAQGGSNGESGNPGSLEQGSPGASAGGNALVDGCASRRDRHSVSAQRERQIAFPGPSGPASLPQS